MPLLQILPLGALIIGHIAPGPLHQVVLHTPPLGLVGGDQHVGRDEEGSVLGKVSVGGIVLEKITRNQSIKYNYLNFFYFCIQTSFSSIDSFPQQEAPHSLPRPRLWR